MARVVTAVVVTTVLSFCVACDAPLDTTRNAEPYSSFGQAVYREGCQRVAYTSSLDDREAGRAATVDVSGALSKLVCVAGEPAPADAPAKVQAIRAQRDALIAAVDAALPREQLADFQK